MTENLKKWTDPEIYDSIYKLGKRFFNEFELQMYIEQIKDYKLNILTFFSCITQEKELVQLETSFLTDKIVYDFTLSKNKSEVCLIPLSKISYVQNTLIDYQKRVLTIYSNGLWLKYKTFSGHDTDFLKQYAIELTGKLNNL
jgi:hypothetical protein